MRMCHWAHDQHVASSLCRLSVYVSVVTAQLAGLMLQCLASALFAAACRETSQLFQRHLAVWPQSHLPLPKRSRLALLLLPQQHRRRRP